MFLVSFEDEHIIVCLLEMLWEAGGYSSRNDKLLLVLLIFDDRVKIKQGQYLPVLESIWNVDMDCDINVMVHMLWESHYDE